MHIDDSRCAYVSPYSRPKRRESNLLKGFAKESRNYEASSSTNHRDEISPRHISEQFLRRIQQHRDNTVGILRVIILSARNERRPLDEQRAFEA